MALSGLAVAALGLDQKVVHFHKRLLDLFLGNAKELAEVIRKILKNPELLTILRNNIIRPSRIEEVAFEYERIYKTMMKEKENQCMQIMTFGA